MLNIHAMVKCITRNIIEIIMLVFIICIRTSTILSIIIVEKEIINVNGDIMKLQEQICINTTTDIKITIYLLLK